VKDRIGELMLLTKCIYRQPAFFPLVDQIKLLLLGSFDKGFSIRFVHVNRLNGKAIKQLRGGKQAVGCVFTTKQTKNALKPCKIKHLQGFLLSRPIKI
jgi:hypothetical protein